MSYSCYTHTGLVELLLGAAGAGADGAAPTAIAAAAHVRRAQSLEMIKAAGFSIRDKSGNAFVHA